jgi:hypothetical protein
MQAYGSGIERFQAHNLPVDAYSFSLQRLPMQDQADIAG